MGEIERRGAKMERHAAATYVTCSLLLVGCAWFSKDTLFDGARVTTTDLLQTGFRQYSALDASNGNAPHVPANSILRHAQRTLIDEAKWEGHAKRVDNAFAH